jgi:ATP-dependent Zn protease
MPETRPWSSRKDREGEKRRQEENRRQVRFSISYLLSSLLALWLFQVFVLTPLGTRSAEISYSDFKKKLANAQIVEVTIGERSIKGEMKNLKPDGSSAAVPFNTVFVFAGDPKLTEELQNANVSYRFERPPSPLGGILLNLLPLALLGGFWYMAYRRAGGGAGGGLGGIFGVRKSKAIEVKPEDVTVTGRHIQFLAEAGIGRGRFREVAN